MKTLHSSSLRAVRLLIVDDREENLYAFGQMLRSESYHVDLARSAQEAFRFLLRYRYACLLCDVQMPEINGYELVSVLRQDPEHRETPVMFITAHGSSDAQVQQAFQLGAVDFVTKPVDPVVLRAKLEVFAALERRQLELQRQRDLFQGVMQSLQEGLIVLEADGTASYTNSRLHQLWGAAFAQERAGEQLREQNLYEPASGAELREEEHPFRMALDGQAVLEREVRVQTASHPDGSYWSVSALPIAPRDSEPVRMAVLIRDIEQQKQAELEIQRKNRDLEQYAYAASHDLKAPLRHITSFAAILEQEMGGYDNAAAQEALKYIVRAANEMRILVDGLLALSTAGAQALEPQLLDLKPLLKRVWDQELRARPTVEAELRVRDDLPCIWADADAMRQVISNLLSNAVKFRKPEVVLRIEVWGDRLPTSTRLMFKDNGIGIAPGHAERIFQVFQRLHTREEYEGSGIGLALCKKILELHGGSIEARGQAGVGAEFVLELPTQSWRASDPQSSRRES